jgi:hypothetical protein
VGYRTERAADFCKYYNRSAEARSEHMDSYTQMPQRVFVDLLEEQTANLSMYSQNDTDVARSRENILQWRAYLPGDCIRTMIQMGWDVTT